MRQLRPVVYIAAYLVAIVAANQIVTRYAREHPEVIAYNAFVFIGLDLVARDALHDAWRGRWLWPRMGALVLAGSLLSYAVNRDATRVAIASALAFAAAATADALVYQWRRRRPWYERSNESNIAGALADSLVFPWVALGSLSFVVLFAQATAKIAGGVVWATIIGRLGADSRARQPDDA